MNVNAQHTAVQQEQHRFIERYYRMHAGIYDLTRWSFLLRIPIGRTSRSW